MEIRSYRRVFELERRVYRVDRLRLNPGGVPVLGIVYFGVLLATSLLAGTLPGLGPLAKALPWFLRYLALPGATAAVLSVIRVEGRPFHQAAHSVLRFALQPRHLAGMRPCGPQGRRWQPDELLMLPDGSDARMRRLRYTGPGAVLVAKEHVRLGSPAGRGARAPGTGRLTRLVVREAPRAQRLSRPQVIFLEPAARLVVDPSTSGPAG